MKVISISGGRSSAMMLYLMQQNGQVDDNTVVIFANTGKESPATLDFIQRCSVEWGINTVWVEYRPVKPFFEVVTYETASRSGEPFAALIEKKGYLPNPVKRICTAELKIKTIRRYIRSLKVRGYFDTYIGLRFDEPSRVAKKKASNALGKEPEYYYLPLYDFRITKADRDVFWSKMPFDLQISSHHDNCDLCYLKGLGTLVNQIRKNPESVEWWIQQEQKVRNRRKYSDGTFYMDRSYKDVKALALNQGVLFESDETGTSLTCSCHD